MGRFVALFFDVGGNIVLLSVNIGKSESYLTLGNIIRRNSLSKVRPLFLK